MGHINETLVDQMAVEMENNTFDKDNYKELSSLSFMEHLNMAKRQTCLKPMVYITYIEKKITGVHIACTKADLPKQNYEVFAVCEGKETAENIKEKLERYLKNNTSSST